MKKLLLSAVAVMATVFASHAQCSVSYTSTQDTATGEWTVNVNSNDPNAQVTFDWGDNSSVFVNGAPITHTYTSGGTYQACAYISDSLSNCYSSFCDSIVETTIAVAPQCYVSIFNVVQDSITSEWSIAINSSNPNASVSVDWGDSTVMYTVYGGSATHTYSTQASYNVCAYLSDSSNNCYTSSCYTINGGATPPPSNPCNASFYIYKDSSIADTWNLALNTIDTAATVIFSWGDNTTSTTTGNNLNGLGHTYANAGVYTVCLTVAIDSVCTDTYCDSLSAFRLNGAIKQLNVKPAPGSVTALKKALPKKLALSLVPNPATSTLTITGVNATEVANVQIMDLTGKTIINTRNTTLTISDLNAGMYLVNVTTTNGVSTISKLIKE